MDFKTFWNEYEDNLEGQVKNVNGSFMFIPYMHGLEDPIYKSYIKEFTYFDYIQGETTGLDHVLYLGDKAQEYKEHVDVSSVFEQRILTCSLILNDNYDGGDVILTWIR